MPQNNFVQNVVPRLSPEEQVEFLDFTSQINQMAKEKANTKSPALVSQRKQGLVNQIYTQGGPNLQGVTQ